MQKSDLWDLVAYDYEEDVSYENTSLTVDLTSPWTEFQEHRWDWHQDVTYFYQDGQRAAELRVNIPHRVCHPSLVELSNITC